MFAAVALITLGMVLIWSAVKGLGITDLFTGAAGDPLDPKGGGQAGSTVPGADPEHPPLTSPSDIPYTGNNAILLWNLEQTGRERFHLTVSSRCRTTAENQGAGGAERSNHLCVDVDGKCRCRACDMTGTVANRVAFARYAKAQGCPEVFCDQAGMSDPNFDHSDHVHIGSDD